MRTVIAGVAVVVLSLAAAAQEAAIYDIVIRNGDVLDGAGNPSIRADVAIKDGRIARVGVISAKGTREIDAKGRFVSPGFIDMMDQSGSTLLVNAFAENKLQQGVTTAIGGEGGTPVPVERLGEYFRRLEEGISINFGTYYSESQARIAVIGRDDRPPTADELTRMQSMMETAMRAGALGMTTALIYPPSSFAQTPELIEMAKTAARYGGIYASHIRGEGAEVVTSVDEAIEIGEKAGLPVEIFHLKVAHQPSWGTLMEEVGRHVDAARQRGVDVAADLYVYTAGGTGLEATIPSWAHEGGNDALIKRLADDETRARLKREITTGSPGWWNIIEAAGGWNGIILANARNAENARFEGKSLAAIAKELGKDPADAAFDLVAQGSGRVMAIYHMMSEPDIERALRFPWTSIGSDAGSTSGPTENDATGLPHPRGFGNFPRVIARYVRERNVLTLPEAIRKMTSWPATRMRLADRGLLREGLWADIVVFDFATIQDRATYEQPRLAPEGIEWVLVNGQVVIEQGKHTNARPGRVLYGPGRQIAAQQTAAAPLLSAPIDVTVPKIPAPFSAQGQTHFVYELALTNLSSEECLVDRVTVHAGDAGGAMLGEFEGEALANAFVRPGVPSLRGVARLRVGAGQRALMHVWVSVPSAQPAPSRLTHRISVRLGERQAAITTNAASIALASAGRPLGPPLRGGGWLAGNGPSNTSGHRRSVLAVDGGAHIAQRFAIDWVQLGPNNATFNGDPKDNRNYYAYGEEILAVADGVVTAIKDGLPENVPGPTSRAIPITLETAGGNYVIVDLGQGRYAFYAHAQPGSIKVRVGQKVRRGDILALVGNSGNSTEPHLHFHVADASSPLGSEGIPYVLETFELEGTAMLQVGKIPFKPLPTPEKRKMELPLQNVVVRFQ
jgi:N-acyl-D-aspartate/D-glutamate deacylase/murein DD-endopeptidase MepM/ murein hydrolase activator NlpD